MTWEHFLLPENTMRFDRRYIWDWACRSHRLHVRRYDLNLESIALTTGNGIRNMRSTKDHVEENGGHKDYGGDCSKVEEELHSNVAAVYRTHSAFCAVRKSDGRIVCWGYEDGGGYCSPEIQGRLNGNIAVML